MKYLLILAVLGGLVAIAGHTERQQLMLERASANCQGSTAGTVPTFEQCLANQFENNGDK